MRFGKAKEDMPRYYHWHQWYAWFPVRTKRGQWVWLEQVMRLRYFDHLTDYFDYRLPSDPVEVD